MFRRGETTHVATRTLWVAGRDNRIYADVDSECRMHGEGVGLLVTLKTAPGPCVSSTAGDDQATPS